MVFLATWAFGGSPDVEHVSVKIDEARLVDDRGNVELVVDSCNGAPRATVSQRNDMVEVEVRAFRFTQQRDFCQDTLTIDLGRIFGLTQSQPAPTQLFDLHAGEAIAIRDER